MASEIEALRPPGEIRQRSAAVTFAILASQAILDRGYGRPATFSTTATTIESRSPGNPLTLRGPGVVALRGDGGRAGRSRRLLETSPTAQAPWPMMSRLSTFENAPGAGCANVCFGSVSDIAQRPRHVRYSPQSGPSSARVARPLCANSTSGALWGLGSLTCYDDDAVNTNAKLTLLVFIVFFLALALAALWML